MAQNTKLNEKAIANAFAIITAIAYIICAVLLWIAPDFAVTIGNYLFHGADISSIVVVRGMGYTIISVIFGAAIAWVTGYVFTVLYNKFVK